MSASEPSRGRGYCARWQVHDGQAFIVREGDNRLFKCDPSLYRDAVMLHEQFGDLIAVFGSSIFHERVRPAGAAIPHIRVNGGGGDPLGEITLASVAA